VEKIIYIWQNIYGRFCILRKNRIIIKKDEKEIDVK